MAAYANAHMLKNFALVEVDGIDMKNQFLSIALSPEQTVVSSRAVDGSVVVEVDTPIWTAAVTVYNSRKAGSFIKAMETAAAAGDTMDFEVQVKSGTGEDTVTFSVRPVYAGFGGETGGMHQAEIVLNVIDQPVFSAAS